MALSRDVPVAEQLAVFKTRRAPKWAGWVKGSATSGLKGSAAARDSSTANTTSNPSYHIVESWNIEKMMEELPTDYYYDRLSEDLRKRHPQADSHRIDHLVSLEAFLDKSILFGFFFGINKAAVVVAEGKLLATRSGGAEARLMKSVARQWLIFRPCAKSCIFFNSSWAARTGCGATCPRNTVTQPRF